jgi:hypothetical protein
MRRRTPGLGGSRLALVRGEMAQTIDKRPTASAQCIACQTEPPHLTSPTVAHIRWHKIFMTLRPS